MGQVIEKRPAGEQIWANWPIMWEELGRALCLMLVLEGIVPFLYPQRWRRLVTQLANINDHQLRYMGLFSMLLGAGLLYLMN
ncbi:DUF2065 domain-containing protein [Pseudomaricurvus alkylphenolicus]|jgi:uncharacterized protein YjeT (DUF2065 family)|uniref:DUF2065 domain-containing protein n=1 Tax=Pseudomaricurvus alkylphenolicus TaxID=1306991 RepID=UPI001F0D4337|nr:DUF2065 domain-containing protein [Pseudomaricurvus alkylphenolicus]